MATKGFNLALTKSRYKELMVRLEEKFDNTDEILAIVRDVFKFDPDVSVYSPSYGKKQIERRKKAMEEQNKSYNELFKYPYNKNTTKNQLVSQLS